MKDKIGFIALMLVVSINCSLTGAAVLGPGSWAVLVSGGAGWYEYGMQADICHAYHVMLQKGLKKENIITMMFDDIAQNPSNPHKGSVFNCPGCPDVYKGVTIDYRAEFVTPENFLNVLLGKESEMKNIGSGKVLKSGSNDTVLINFSGHGEPGLIIFPKDHYLYSKDLIHTLNTMKTEKKFGKIFLYFDTCFSGSMFDNQIEHFDNVFAITSAAIDEPSYNTYCDLAKFGTCMAGLFEIKWMDRLDQNISETIFDNYDALRTAVYESHVQLYGDYKLGFQEDFTPGQKSMKTFENHLDVGDSLIPKREVQLYMAKMDALTTNVQDAKQKWKHYKNILKARYFADNILTTIMNNFTGSNTVLRKELESKRYPLHLDMFDCYKRLVSSFNDYCFHIHENTYLLNHIYKLANICIKNLGEEKAINVIRRVCQENIKQIKKFGAVI